MNAIAFMIYNLGGYRKSDSCPARAGRRDMSGEFKCTTAVGDAYVLGNKHKHLRYKDDWPVKERGVLTSYTPQIAYYLADKGTKLTCLSIVPNPPSRTGDIVARGRCYIAGIWPRGHAGILISNNTTISANDTFGIRFNDWVKSYRDYDPMEDVLTRRYTK